MHKILNQELGPCLRMQIISHAFPASDDSVPSPLDFDSSVTFDLDFAEDDE